MKFTAKLRNFQTNLSQPRREKSLPRFSCQTGKIKLRFSSCFLPRFPCCYTDLEIHAQEKNLENRAQKSASKIVLDVLKTVLYGQAINASVLSSIFVPSLLLSFPSICVLQFIFSFSEKNGKFLSQRSPSLQSAKVSEMAFPCLFGENPRVH